MKSVYLIAGDDEFNIHESARHVLRQLTGPSPDEFSLEIYRQADDLENARLLDDLLCSLQTPPFLSGRKTVWLQHVDFLDRESEHLDRAKIKDEVAMRLARLTEFIKNHFPNDINLVIDGVGADPDKPLVNACREVGNVKVHTKPNLTQKHWRGDVRRALERSLRERHMRASAESVEYLIEVIGVDTARIDREIEKLFCYAGEQPTFEQVREVCVGNREAIYYALTNAVGTLNLDLCLRTIAQLEERAKESDNMALGQMRQLGRYINDLLHAKLMVAFLKNPSVSEVAGKMNAMPAAHKERVKHNHLWDKSEWQVRALAEQAAKFTGPELIAALHAAAEINQKLVSTSASPRLTLELFICQLLGGRAPAARTSR